MAKPSEEKLREALKECYDPEIPVNIVDLGLIRDIQIDDDGSVFVNMTLTAVGCPVTDWMQMTVKEKVEAVEGVSEARVEIGFEPPWDPSQLTPEGKDMLEAMGFPV